MGVEFAAANVNSCAKRQRIEELYTASCAPLMEGKIFTEVLGGIRYKIKPENSFAEIRKTKGEGVLVELGVGQPKSTFCKAVEGQVGGNPTASLDRNDPSGRRHQT